MDRRTTIILAAIDLFARKGFHETSMQTIAAESNIAKGTIYSYFHSKDELLYSIMKYFYEETILKLKEIDGSSLAPKEKFRRKLEVTMEERLKYKDFFMIQHREQTLNANRQIKEVYLAMQEQKLRWMVSSFEEVYGKGVEDHGFDLAALLDSMIYGFIRIVSVEKDAVTIRELADFLLTRFDAIVEKILAEHWSPLFPAAYKDEFLDYIRLSTTNKELAYQLKQMVSVIRDLPKDAKKEELIQTVDFLRDEIAKKEPRTMILKGVIRELEFVKELAEPLNQMKRILELD